MKKTLFALLLLIATILSACTQEKAEEVDVKEATSNESVKGTKLEEVTSNYLSHVDVDYSYDFTRSLEEFKTNEKLGYRTAGSEAEIKTGIKIYDEMKAIGLTEVVRDEFTLDTWEFEKADMYYTDASGKEHEFVLGGYQVTFDTKGLKEFEIVYGGRGTEADLKDLNVKDKLVIIDVNQLEDWWVTFPTYQVHLKGAAAVIAVQDGGYAEVDPSALNTQDIIGPADAPVFSMSQVDAEVLKEDLTNSEDGIVNVEFDAKSTVGFDGKSYNVSGKIVGKDPDSYILLSAHYDSYFTGFQDDNAAIGLMMGIAKSLVDSGYQPEKTIIFNALAAEEWGVSNSHYDWSTGAYNQIFRVHPEWAGKAVANINFELPAYEHETQDEIRATYELKNYLEEFTKMVPSVDGVYEEGIAVVAPLHTWSDDWSFSIAGVPALRNDFKDSDFMKTHYHSDFDTSDTYNEKAFEYHHNLYGLLTIYYDRTAVTPLDFTVRLNDFKDKINLDTFEAGGVSAEALTSEIEKAYATPEKVNEKVNSINNQYKEALENGDSETAQALYKDSRQLSGKLLEAYKYAQDQFVKLTWEDEPIFPHEHPQENIQSLAASIEALNNGDVATPVDDYLWMVDNNWYAYEFDKETYNYFTDYVLHQPADRLMWGAGRVLGNIDLFDTINSLQEKYDVPNADVSKEVETLNTALKGQKELLQTTVNDETEAVKALNDMLSELK